MNDETKFIYIGSATWPGCVPAIIAYGNVFFYSAQPIDQKHANHINQTVEDITGTEIPTIL